MKKASLSKRLIKKNDLKGENNKQIPRQNITMIQRKCIHGTIASSEEPNKSWTCFRRLWQCCGHPMAGGDNANQREIWFCSDSLLVTRDSTFMLGGVVQLAWPVRH